MNAPYLSIVSPIYRAENILERLVNAIEHSIKSITDNYELILVEDGSPDNSWAMLEQLARNNPKLKAIKLSRNFGQHYAITAGLDAAKGEWVVVMDCDLQDRPEEIVNLHNKALEGYDLVLAQRIKRFDSIYKRSLSFLFYKIFTYLSGLEQDSSISNFGIYHRKVVNAVNFMREPLRAFPPMIQWVGFKKAHLEVTHAERIDGKSSYTFSKLLNLALDISISYSDKPLKLIVKFGFYISFFSFLYILYMVFIYLNGEIGVIGYTSLIVSILFSLGLTMLTLGIIGLYIGKIFVAAKNRPIYLIDEIIN